MLYMSRERERVQESKEYTIFGSANMGQTMTQTAVRGSQLGTALWRRTYEHGTYIGFE